VVSRASIPVVILCGGDGTRFREETQFRPKPLVAIGEYPILWHVMKIYASQGFSDFIVCLGYKGWMIKEYFLNYEAMTRDFSIQLGEGRPRFGDTGAGLGWRITFVDTGLGTMTGARLKRVERYVESEQLMVTYADGVADIDVCRLLEFHLAHGGIGTVTGVSPPLPFGEMVLEGSRVARFTEKPRMPCVINGGFFVFRREIFKYVDEDDSCVLERSPLEHLARDGELHAYVHDGFWQCLDTYKDQLLLEGIWRSGRAPWRGAT
jgi:glucose-1-phosphate cytidylyltransferase